MSVRSIRARRAGAAAALLAFVALAGCGRSGTDGADVATQPPCGAAGAFDDTGICKDGAPERFRSVSGDLDLYDPKCVWRTEQARLSPDEVMVFRTQECAAAGIALLPYAFAEGRLAQVLAGAEGDPTPLIEVFDAGDRPVGDVLSERIAALPEPERSRCAARPHATPFADAAFLIAPDPAYEEELKARDEPYDACGPWGVGPWEAYWEVRDGKALFFNLGQDQPPFDPRSVTFYRRDADGAWRMIVAAETP